MEMPSTVVLHMHFNKHNSLNWMGVWCRLCHLPHSLQSIFNFLFHAVIAWFAYNINHIYTCISWLIVCNQLLPFTVNTYCRSYFWHNLCKKLEVLLKFNMLLKLFFLLKHFSHFLLRNFGHWNISVICLTVVLKLSITVFLAYIFRHSNRND